jgi:hypothetical protein
LVAATVSWVVGGVVVVAGAMAEPEAGAMDSEAGADDDIEPLDGAIAPEPAGALAEALEPTSEADIAPSVEAAGAVSSAGF